MEDDREHTNVLTELIPDWVYKLIGTIIILSIVLLLAQAGFELLKFKGE